MAVVQGRVDLPAPLLARTDPRPAVAELARSAGARVRTLEHRLATLEEAFVGIVGRE